MWIHLAATVVESLSKARALHTKPCQRAAEGPSSTAWTRPQILARGPKALNRLLLPAPATKQEPPTKGTAPELDNTHAHLWYACGNKCGSEMWLSSHLCEIANSNKFSIYTAQPR